MFLSCGVRSEGDEYAPIAKLDDCGQRCSASCEEETEMNFTRTCRCDAECVRFGDCCSGRGHLKCYGGASVMKSLRELQCREIQVDRLETYWMVSSCPDTQNILDGETMGEVNEMCAGGSDTLPPVTDLDSGVVYKNEYCAICHRISNILPWVYRFECLNCSKFHGLCLNDIRTIIPNECTQFGFSVPHAAPLPRPCVRNSAVDLDALSSCLPKKQLENATRRIWGEHEYTKIESQCKSGPLRLVVSSANPRVPAYRNQYCSICNGDKPAFLTCTDVKKLSIIPSLDFHNKGCISLPQCSSNIPHILLNSTNDTSSRDIDMVDEFPVISLFSFTLFFDVNRHSGGIKYGNNEKNTIPNLCQKDEVFNPFTQTCHKAICPEGFDTQRRLCPILVSNTSNGTIICNGYPLVLKESMFRFIDNNTVIFNGEYFNIIDYNNSMPIICINEILLSNRATFFYPIVFLVLTYVCCSLSAIGCAFVLLTYSLFKELRVLPGRILMNLTAAILATYLFLLIGNPLANATKKQEICETTAIFLHWLMLSQFFWMSIMNLETLRMMCQGSNLCQVENSTVANKMFLLYFSIGWGIPATIILVIVVVNFTTDNIQYGKDGVCWIGQTASFFAAFLTPVILFILFNGITFVVTFTFLFRASREQAKFNTQSKISFIRVTIAVFSITGLTWIFGFVALFAKEIWVWCVYIILTSTQGLFICIAFTFTKKIFSMYKKILRRQSIKNMCYEFKAVDADDEN